MRKYHFLCTSALLLLFACDKKEAEDPKPDPVIPKIEVSQESQAIFSQGISIESGTSAQSQSVKFTATAAWSADVADTKASSWLSVQPTSGAAGSVTMTVTAQANTGKDAREATVTIKCGTASQKFTVKQAGVPDIDVESIDLDKTEITLVEGEELTLSATVKPDNATDKTVTWTSSNAEIATVDNGKVTAVKEGTVTITAKAGEKEATCKVNVAKKTYAVESITLNKTELNLKKGESETLVATVLPENASDKTVTWSSSDATIASVDQTGKVTAVKSGSVTITAKASDKTATCAVKVTTPVESISLDRNSVTLEEGKSTTLVATVNPADADEKTVSWSSSNSSVAIVENGVVAALSEGETTITASAGGKSATCKVTVQKKVVPVSSVTLNKTTLSLVKGQSEMLTATVKPNDATDKTVTWSSSDVSVVTVDQNGKVTAIDGGTATIKAASGEESAECVVKVTVPVESVTLDKTSIELKKGETINIVATVNPENASDKTVTWSSSDATVARVDQTGKVAAVKGGSVTITAKAGDKTATCAVKVTTPVESISLDRNSVTLEEGQNTTLVATINPNDADEKTVNWSSSNSSVATVNNGVITALSEGETTITASAGGKSATCKVTVQKKVVPVSSVTLNKTTLSLLKGQSETLTATVNPDDATDKAVTWSSSDATIATVDQSGKVTAVNGGEVIIKAACGEKSAECTVTVTVPVESVSLDKTSVELKKGDTVILVATINPADASDKTLTWSSSDATIVTVDQTGKVTAVKSGTATITVKAGDKQATCAVTVSDSNTEDIEDGGEKDW